MKITDEPVMSLIDSLEKAGCENARFIITIQVLPKAEQLNTSLKEVILSFKNESPETHKFKLYQTFLKIKKGEMKKADKK